MKKRRLGIIFTLLLILFVVKCGDFTINENEKVTTTSSGTTGCTICQVFVTSTTSDGDLGGLSGADSTCKTLAADAGLTGTNWAAWLSTITVDAKDRINDAEYNLVDGTGVANDLADLIDGIIQNAIVLDEDGTTRAGAMTWTGTTDLGLGDARGSNYCTNWTSTGATAVLTGNSSGTADWSESAPGTCNTSDVRFYCFEI